MELHIGMINKKMKYILITLLLFPLLGISQKMFSTKYASQTDVHVFVTQYESQADLKVYKVEYPSRAIGNEGLWFFAQWPSQSDKRIFFVEYESQSNLRIFFVDYKSRAGWQNNEKKYLLY